jgi:hypothetical protein
MNLAKITPPASNAVPTRERLLLMLDIGGLLKIVQGGDHGAETVLDECRCKGEESKKVFFSNSAAHLLSIVCLFQQSR